MLNKPALIIGQAQRPETIGTPFLRSNLWKWFAQIGYEAEEIMALFQFDALVNHGTPKGKKGRVPPQPEQIKTYRPQLIENIDKQNPKLIIPIGNLAMRHTFAQPKILLDDVVGKKFTLQPFGECKREMTIIPLPHPSGVSLWLNSAANKALLQQALKILQQEIEHIKKSA